MPSLRQHLYECYGGFSDRRVKDLSKSDTFIADDRSDRDRNARGELYGYFCMIFVRVKGDGMVEVDLRGNVPMSDGVREWVRDVGASYATELQPSLQFSVTRDEMPQLEQLAERVEAIVAPGAPRYNVPNYKYVCPRTGASLRRLAHILGDYWTSQQR